MEIARALGGGVLVMYDRYALRAWFRTAERQQRARRRCIIQRAALRWIIRALGT